MVTSDHAIGDRAARQHGLVTRQQAIDAGLSASGIQRRTASGRWMPMARGVYLVRGATITWQVKVMAACLATGGVASHRSAAVLTKLDGFRPGRVEITVPRGARYASLAARVHESRDFHLVHPTRRDGIPMTPPARLAVDLGACVPFPHYERAMEQMIGDGLLTWDRALDALLDHARPGRAGVGPLRALVMARYGDHIDKTELERAFARLMRRSDLPPPEPQVAIYDHRGFVARVDYAYPQHKVAIELDSKRWHLNGVSFEEDRRKRNRLKAAGWTVLELTWHAIFTDPRAVIALIGEVLAS